MASNHGNEHDDIENVDNNHPPNNGVQESGEDVGTRAENHREPKIKNFMRSLLLPMMVGDFNDRLSDEDHIEEQNRENQAGHTKGQDGRISAALFIGNLLAFIIAALLTNIMAYKESVKIAAKTVEVILLVLITLGILAMLFLWCVSARPSWQHVVHGPAYQNLDDKGYVSGSFTFSLFGVWIFGLGSIAFLALKSAADILCGIKMYKAWDCAWAVLDPIRCLTQTVFLLIQMAFLSFFNIQQLARNFVLHYLLLMIIAANFSVWFYTILNDSDLLFGSWESRRDCILKTDQNTSKNDFEKCYNQTTDLYHTVESSEPFLYPFVLEYSILSVGLLLGMWSRTGVLQRAREITPQGTSCLQTPWCAWTLIGSVFVNAIFVLFSGLMHDKEYYKDFVRASYIYSIIYTFLFLISPLWFGFYRLQVDGRKGPETVSNVKEYILLLSGFGILVFAYFSLIAAVCVNMGATGSDQDITSKNPSPYETTKLPGETTVPTRYKSMPVDSAAIRGYDTAFGFHYNTTTLTPGYDTTKTPLPMVHISKLVIADGVLNLVQVWLQSAFLVYADRLICNAPDLKLLSLHLSVSNFAYWIVNSFFAVRGSATQFGATPIQQNYFPSGDWYAIMHIVFPLGIFYRFHSCELFLQLFRKFAISSDQPLEV